MPETQGPDVKQILEVLEKDYLLVGVRFHRWSGLLIAEEAEVILDGRRLNPEQITWPRWRLMPESLKRVIARINRKVRRDVDAVSVPSHLQGLRLTPRAVVPGLFNRLITHRADLDTSLDDLILARYDELLAEIETKLDTDFPKVEPHIPGPQKLRSRFGLKWFAALLVEAELPKGPGIDAARKQFAEMAVETFTTMVEEVRGEVADAAATLAERIEQKGICKQGTLDRVRRAFARLRVFESLGDDDLLAKISALDKDLETTPKDLNLAIQDEEDSTRELARKLRVIERRARDPKVIDEILRHAGWPVPVGP